MRKMRPPKVTISLAIFCLFSVFPINISQENVNATDTGTPVPNTSSTDTNTTATDTKNSTDPILSSTTDVSTTLATTTTTTAVPTTERPKGPVPLCGGEDDELGRKLGCNCTNLVGGPLGILSAQCVDSWIGYNSTMNLPPRLNISRHVRILDLSKNYLEILDENTFGDCEGLSKLILYKNHIREVKSLSCFRLQSLDLSWNHISKLKDDAFKNLPQLQELDLSFNGLIFVEPHALEKLQNLRSLNLASNPLGDELNFYTDYILSLENLQKLEELDLSNTSLPDFPETLINGTRNIKILKLKNNLINTLPENALHQLPNLEYLDLSGNWFETLVPYGFDGLKNLRTLVIDKSPNLKEIQQHAFAGLVSLRELSCQRNHFLTVIDVMAFRMAKELEKEAVEGDSHPKIVQLGDNNLNFIEYGLLDWKNMEMLELHRNPWVCDCNLQWVAKYHAARPADAAILTDSDFDCAHPHIFAGVPVAKVDAAEMLCYSPAATIAGTVGIIVFVFLLFTFCSIIILNHMGMLPDWVRNYNIFGSGSSLPKYMRVNPKPTRARMGVNSHEKNEPTPGDLEWDNGDIGPT